MPRKGRLQLGSTVSGAEQSRRSWSVGNLIDWHRRGEIKRNMGGGSHGGGRGTGGGAELGMHLFQRFQRKSIAQHFLSDFRLWRPTLYPETNSSEIIANSEIKLKYHPAKLPRSPCRIDVRLRNLRIQIASCWRCRCIP